MKVLLFLVLCVFAVNGSPIWKVFCGSSGLYKGRLDPIVNPGKYSGHTHQVSGGNHFSPAGANQSPMEVYNDMLSSSCTTCSIREIDNSAYWHPDLYYQWPNGTFSVVPYSGLTVYYLSRTPSSGYDSSYDNKDVWTPIPKGLRMLAGNPYRRNYSGSLEDQAVSYACLNYNGGGGPETNGFPTNNRTCPNGLRAQVFFPMCWDGKNLDSADHKSHMAYPSNYNGGNCPSTHSVRIPGVFFEALYSVDKFPHGKGTNPFVWSNGDPTGYGFHGDFLSGWNTEIMAQAISDPSCDIDNKDLAIGNNVKACKPFSQYVQDAQPQGACNMYYRTPLTEDLGIANAIPALPGCNPITNGPAEAVPCSKAPNATAPSGIDKRFMLQSVATKNYVTASPDRAGTIVANVTGDDGFTYAEVWTPVNIAPGTALQNEATLQWVSASGTNSQLFCNRGSPSTSDTSYEAFTLVPQQGKNDLVAIKAIKNGKYVTVNSDGSLTPTATAVTNNELFQLVQPNGGYIGIAAYTNPTFPTSSSSSPSTPTVPSASSGSAPAASSGSAPTGSQITALGQGGVVDNGASTIMGSVALIAIAALM